MPIRAAATIRLEPILLPASPKKQKAMLDRCLWVNSRMVIRSAGICVGWKSSVNPWNTGTPENFASTSALDRDNLNTRLVQEGVGVDVALVSNDDAGLEAQQVVGVIPLFAGGLIGIATGRDVAQFREAKGLGHDHKKRFFLGLLGDVIVLAGA